MLRGVVRSTRPSESPDLNFVHLVFSAYLQKKKSGNNGELMICPNAPWHVQRNTRPSESPGLIFVHLVFSAHL